MNAHVFRLPDLGEGLTEAVLVAWLVSEGDAIRVDQAVAEVETAKSTVEVPSPYAGRVVALHGAAGDTILTGSPLIEVQGNEEASGSGNVLIGYGTGAGPARGQRRRRGGEARAALSPDPALTPTPTAPAAAAMPTVPGPVAVRSPIVRRLARELGIDPHTVAPSGSDGAVTRADVLRAAQNGAGADVMRAVGSAAVPSTGAGTGTGTNPLGILRTDPLSPLRRAVSAKLSRSRSEIPEATVWVDADLTELWNLRPKMARPGEQSPSLTALFARFTLLALAQYPMLAGRLSEQGDEVSLFDGVNLGVAVDTERGLLVPVIPRADELNIAQLNDALREASRVVRDGHTTPTPLYGSTFTLNNYGGLGVDGSAAIINHPEVALLGIGRVLERPWVVDGQIVPRRIAQLSLVFDHRVCDGGYAAGFLRAVVDLFEHPLTAYPRV